MNAMVKGAATLVGLVILAASIWMSFATKNANKTINEANAAIDKANGFSEMWGNRYKELFNDEVLAAFPGNRDQLRPVAQTLADSMNNAARELELAATKFDEAAKKGLGAVVTDYWTLKGKFCQRMAESKRKYGQVALLFHDQAISDSAMLDVKMNQLLDEAAKLNTEATEFSTQADKLHAENRDKFD